MLKNIDPVLTPALLKCLAEMGHEDAIVLADANFTAERFRASTVTQQVLRLPGLSLARVAQAVLSVMPLGVAAEQPVRYMQVGGTTAPHRNAAQQAVVELVNRAQAGLEPLALERFAFYEQARHAHVIVVTGELAPYANFIFKKGVIVAA
jgi:L-fucose mutarotase